MSALAGDDRAGSRARRKGPEIRSLILDAARELFAAQGYHRTSTREIASAAGVSERLIYFHFTTKATLFERAVAEPFTAFMEEFVANWRGYADNPHDFEYVARQWIGGMYDLLRKHRKLVLALLTASAYEDEVDDNLSGKDSPLAQIHRLTEEIMAAEAKNRGYHGLDLRLTVRLPFATLLAAAVFDGPVMAGIGRRPSRDTIVEEMAALTLYGSTGRSQMKDPPNQGRPI
ncbi:MAG TPA: helix-turn-helix domain-containing protein [Pseudonocardia sp.]